MNRKPNILLIEVDQMPWFALSRTGNKNVRTPNLDRLIDDGVLFNNATVQNPICLPSRVSMLSGQYISTLGQFGFCGYCRQDTEWLQGVFKRNGYTTGAFGKFHAISVGYEQWDFDLSAPTLGEDDDLSRPADNNYRAYCRTHGIKWPTDQMHGHDPYNGVNGLIRASSAADSSDSPMLQFAAASDVPDEHSLERWTADQYIDFIQKNDSGKASFAWLTFDRPHFPTALSPYWQQRIRPDEIDLAELPGADVLCGLPRKLFNDYSNGSSQYNLGEKKFRYLLASYFSLIESIDAEIGRVIAALKERGDYDNTIIVFTADHGDEAGRNGLYNKIQSVDSEAITRIAIVFKPQKGKLADERRGTVLEGAVENIDLFPSLCSLSGLDIPPGVQGRDLSPVLQGEKEDLERPVFCEDYFKRMIKKGPWRMTFEIGMDNQCMLHNLDEDPLQWNNLYHDPQFREKRIELKLDLLKFLNNCMFGTYTAADVERLERGLDPEDSMLPIHCTINVTKKTEYDGIESDSTLQFFRAGIYTKGQELALILLDSSEVLLFSWTGEPRADGYHTRDRALAYDPEAIEQHLDYALRYIMRHILPISTFTERGPVTEALATREEVEKLLSAYAAQEEKDKKNS